MRALPMCAEHILGCIPCWKRALVLGTVLGTMGCKDLTGNPGFPAGTPNPAFYNTPIGAQGMHTAAIYVFQKVLVPYVVDAGLLADELEDVNTGASTGALIQNGGQVTDPLDERILPEGSAESPGTTGGTLNYRQLQGVREFANQAIGALATYDTIAADTITSKVMRGELYALEGFSEVMLADLFCSGVPLSTLDYQKAFTYQAGSTTAQVYQAAIANFDAAIVLSDTSTQVLNLARVGRGRAFLDLGQYDSAAAAVAQVPDGFSYTDTVDFGEGYRSSSDIIFTAFANVSDHEGGNGLPYISSADPRTAVVYSNFKNTFKDSLFFPVKYRAALGGSFMAPVPIADWIEARLIQAEAALQAHDYSKWLALLNHLRETATVPGQTMALADTSDPGTDAGRVALLFQERAYWLFLTGHRQGDLRRALRQYSQYPAFQSQQQVYPTGLYRAPGLGVYGSDVTVPIPSSEYANPLFHGCLNREP